ncbi:MAG: T9SS type A sorting domain-containing protein [Bacteroidia bacterium]
MKKYGSFFCIIFMAIAMNAQVPKLGKDSLLDVACWNIEWFGNTTPGNGPSNKTVQFNNVLSVLAGSDIDVWGLEEVSDSLAWNNLTNALPAYDRVLTTYAWTQKTALLWKKSLFSFVSSRSILTDAAYNTDFAGRPPLEVVLRTNFKPVTDTIYFYVIHLKAYSDQTSYGRRKNAAGYIKTFLDANRKNKYTFVLGDWNDDVNGSISAGQPSPFTNFVNDSNNYFFITKSLSDAGKSSFISGGHMIDQTLLTTPMRNFYVSNSSRVLDTITNFIANYASNNTSDHYPVMGFYSFNGSLTTGLKETVPDTEWKIFPNPSGSQFYFSGNEGIKDLEVINYLGEKMKCSFEWKGNKISLIKLDDNIPDGVYFVQIETSDKMIWSEISIQK